MSVARDSVDPSPVEREIKIADVNLEQLRSHLRTCGARQSVVRHWERNWVLDRDQALRSSQRVLRVREQRNTKGDTLGTWLTVKALVPGENPGYAANQGVKERLERETRVADVDELLAAFELLDYRVARRYEKVRSVFLFDGHEVTLDETPIGDFVEIEGPAPRPIAESLNLRLADIEVVAYLELYDRYRARQRDDDGSLELGADMLFDRRGSAAAGCRPAPPGFEHLTNHVFRRGSV